MILESVIIFAVVIVCITFIYKLMPFRDLAHTKPALTLFPKYRTTLQLSDELSDDAKLEDRFSQLGFTLRKTDENKRIFYRGSLLGDFSVKILKLKCAVVTSPDSTSLTIEAGWMIAFDTGDLWTFTSELKQKLQCDSAN